MKRLGEQIGGDVNIGASDVRHILMGMTDQLLKLLDNYVQEMDKALISGDIDKMEKMQYQMPVNIVDDLLHYHIDHWRDELQKAQNNYEMNESGSVTALTVITVYQGSYLQNLIAYLLSMGYQATLHLIT